MTDKTITVRRDETKRGRYTLYSNYTSRVLFEIPEGAYAHLLVWSDGRDMVEATTETENSVLYLEEQIPEGGGAAVVSAIGYFLDAPTVTAILTKKQPVFYRLRYIDGEDITVIAKGRVVEGS